MNVLICPCGEGLGHTTRCAALAGEFISQGHKVAFAAYGNSAAFLRKYKFKVYDSEAEISLAGENGKFKMMDTVINSKSILFKMFKAAYKECRAIEDFKADIVISDSKYSALLAAKIKGLRSIIIINQNNMSMDGIKKFIGYAISGFIKNLNKIADRVVVPDFAPPYTVCEHNLSKARGDSKVHFVGPLVSSEKWRKDCASGKHVLSLIGGFGYRARILKKINALAMRRNDKKFKLVCGFSKIDGMKKAKNAEIIGFEKSMDRLWQDCELVVAHAGHSTLMEMSCFGKPGIIIPDDGHPEQENNAKKISELGCGIVLSHRELTVDKIDRAMNEIDKNSDYMKAAKKMREMAKRYNAKKTVVRMAESLASRSGRQKGAFGRLHGLFSGN